MIKILVFRRGKLWFLKLSTYLNQVAINSKTSRKMTNQQIQIICQSLVLISCNLLKKTFRKRLCTVTTLPQATLRTEVINSGMMTKRREKKQTFSCNTSHRKSHKNLATKSKFGEISEIEKCHPYSIKFKHKNRYTKCDNSSCSNIVVVPFIKSKNECKTQNDNKHHTIQTLGSVGDLINNYHKFGLNSHQLKTLRRNKNSNFKNLELIGQGSKFYNLRFY